MPCDDHTAIRTCVACRRRFPASDLLRITLDADERLRLDARRVAPGRGAWVCIQHACVARLQEKPALASRSLRQRPRGSTDLLRDARAWTDHRALQALRQSHRAGLVRSRAAQRHAVADTSVLAVLRPLDSEADGPDHASTELPTPWTRIELGAALGRGPRSRLLLLKGAPSRRLLRKLRLRAALG
ncbi:MAG: DUF448 domain-containing protein [Myxococcota bacterium]|nr:DUF448 domain-containing protein [Myxococcota bacterium]